MKSAFSLLELIFTIVILGIVAFFAVPKFMGTKDSALASTIKRDVNTVVNSIQSYYMLNQKIEKISDALNISSDNWTIEDSKEDSKLTDKNSCVSIELKNSTSPVSLAVSVDSSKTSDICKKIQDSGIESKTYEIY